MISRYWQMLVGLFFISCLTACSSTTNSTNADSTNVEKQASETNNLADINIQLAFEDLKRNDMREARERLLSTTKQAPDYAPSWYAMAYLEESTGNLDRAKEDYLHALSLAPHDGDTQNNYGTFLCRHGENQEAIEHFLTAAQNPQYLDAAAAYENAGICALKIPDKTKAQKYFERAYLQANNRPTTLLNLAQLSYDNKKYQDAQIYLQRFLNVSDPTSQSQQLANLLVQQKVS